MNFQGDQVLCSGTFRDFTKWGEHSPPEVHLSRRSSAVADEFEVSIGTWEVEGAPCMPNGDCQLSIDQTYIDGLSKFLRVPVKFCPVRLQVREEAP